MPDSRLEGHSHSRQAQSDNAAVELETRKFRRFISIELDMMPP